MNKKLETITHAEYIKPKLEALAKHLECDVEDITELNYDHYGLTHVKAEGAEYAIGEDAECDDACKQYVGQSAWTFKASFICEQCELPFEMQDAIKALLEKCEDANDSILALINKCTTLKDFTYAAISADGRGQFLSSYDHNEIELGSNLYAYRTN